MYVYNLHEKIFVWETRMHNGYLFHFSAIRHTVSETDTNTHTDRTVVEHWTKCRVINYVMWRNGVVTSFSPPRVEGVLYPKAFYCLALKSTGADSGKILQFDELSRNNHKTLKFWICFLICKDLFWHFSGIFFHA